MIQQIEDDTVCPPRQKECSTPRTAAVLRRILRRQWTQAKFAGRVGINRCYLSLICGGKRPATSGFVGKTCAILTREEAGDLLDAYLTDVAECVACHEQSAGGRRHRTVRREFKIVYPGTEEVARGREASCCDSGQCDGPAGRERKRACAR